MILQVIQVMGSLLILTGFVLAQHGTLKPDNRVYLWLNFVGAAILAILAVIERQAGFFLLEGVWTLVSAHGLWRSYGRQPV